MLEFIEASATRAYTIAAIRRAFKFWVPGWRYRSFDICAIHHLPQFSYLTFAPWAKALAYEGLGREEVSLLKFYVVNYLLCPHGDEFEVEALVREIWPGDAPITQPGTRPRVILWIGRLRLVWGGLDAR